MFVSLHAKHEAMYIHSLRKIKTHTPQFSLENSFNIFVWHNNVYSFLNCFYIFGVPKQMPRWTFGVQLTWNAPWPVLSAIQSNKKLLFQVFSLQNKLRASCIEVHFLFKKKLYSE